MMKWFIFLVIFTVYFKVLYSSETANVVYSNLANVTHDIPQITLSGLSGVLDKIDAPELNSIHVKIVTSYPINGDELDKFLTTRPYWIWEYIVNDSTGAWILLRREPKRVDKILQAFASRQFHDHCESTPIAYDYTAMDSWGNRFAMFSLFSKPFGFPYVVYNMRDDKKQQWVTYLDYFECSKEEKWGCLFLPQTNCPLPTTIDDDCPHKDAGGGSCIDGVVVYDKATANAKVVDDTVKNKLINEYQTKKVEASNEDHVREATEMSFTSMIISNSTVTVSKSPGSGYLQVERLFALGFTMRFNTKFAELVFKKVQAFRDSFSPSFHPQERCVAIHIRRGDRTKVGKGIHDEGENVRDWCAKYSKFDKDNRWVVDESTKFILPGWPKEANMYYGFWMDIGCQLEIPYGAATFDHYLNASRLIAPTVNNVFIMTDDEEALKADLKLLKSHSTENRKIFPFPGHRKNSVDSSAQWFAANIIASQCEALVAYQSSAASQFIRDFMALSSPMRLGHYERPAMFHMGQHRTKV